MIVVCSAHYTLLRMLHALRPMCVCVLASLSPVLPPHHVRRLFRRGDEAEKITHRWRHTVRYRSYQQHHHRRRAHCIFWAHENAPWFSVFLIICPIATKRMPVAIDTLALRAKNIHKLDEEKTKMYRWRAYAWAGHFVATPPPLSAPS